MAVIEDLSGLIGVDHRLRQDSSVPIHPVVQPLTKDLQEIATAVAGCVVCARAVMETN